MHSGQWRLGHRPGLDGLRGIAVLLVMAAHLWQPVITWGTAGVTMFFTLSGFLITALLLQEGDSAGRVSFAGFYRRRALRLLPALLVVLAACAIAGTASPIAAGAALLYVGNWVQAFGSVDMGSLAHTWSLAIEEQFYLLWPALVVAAVRSPHWRRWLIGVAVVGCAWAAVARLVLWDRGHGLLRVYMGSDTRMDAVLVGCLLALWLHGRAVNVLRHPRVVDACMVVIVAAVVLPQNSAIDYLALPVWLPWATAVVILAVVRGGYAGLLTARWLRWFGRRSYGIYLWHGAAVLTVHEFATGIGGAVATVVVGVSLAALSWRYVEQPFLRLKGRSGSRGVVIGDAGAREGGPVVRDLVDVADEPVGAVATRSRVGRTDRQVRRAVE